MARSLGYSKIQYLNYDEVEGRSVIRARTWSRDVDLVVFDELHKMKGWKRWIKGIYDVEGASTFGHGLGAARCSP